MRFSLDRMAEIAAMLHTLLHQIVVPTPGTGDSFWLRVRTRGAFESVLGVIGKRSLDLWNHGCGFVFREHAIASTHSKDFFVIVRLSCSGWNNTALWQYQGLAAST